MLGGGVAPVQMPAAVDDPQLRIAEARREVFGGDEGEVQVMRGDIVLLPQGEKGRDLTPISLSDAPDARDNPASSHGESFMLGI
jgi:hypothetical protein